MAVCCCSDSERSSVRWRSSLSSRAFSMAMTACVGEWPHVGAGEAQHAYWDALAQHGNSEHGANPSPNPVENEVRIGIHIGDVNSTAFEQGTSGDTAAFWRDRHVSPAFHDFGGEAV